MACFLGNLRCRHRVPATFPFLRRQRFRLNSVSVVHIAPATAGLHTLSLRQGSRVFLRQAMRHSAGSSALLTHLSVPVIVIYYGLCCFVCEALHPPAIQKQLPWHLGPSTLPFSHCSSSGLEGLDQAGIQCLRHRKSEKVCRIITSPTYVESSILSEQISDGALDPGGVCQNSDGLKNYSYMLCIFSICWLPRHFHFLAAESQ